MRYLVTGGCGFIGHHLVDYILDDPTAEVTVIDKLTYASFGLDRLRENGSLDRIRFFAWDLMTPLTDGLVSEVGPVDIIIHLAAETHVDNSISDPVYCINNNVLSTINLLEFARKIKIQKFLMFSTDEVYGPALNDRLFSEDDAHNPSNPYSASKSASESVALSYMNTFGIPVLITNTMNVFGPRQHDEKFIPLCVKRITTGDEVLIHSYPGCKQSGSRFYINVKNVCSAVMFLLDRGVCGERYNIAGSHEVTNLEMAQKIAQIMGKDLSYKMIDFHADRPGHDLRYGLSDDKLRSLGWVPPYGFEDALRDTVVSFCT